MFIVNIFRKLNKNSYKENKENKDKNIMEGN